MRQLRRWFRRISNTPLVFLYAIIVTFVIEQILTGLSQALDMPVLLLALLTILLLGAAYFLLTALIRLLRPPRPIPMGDRPMPRRGLILLLGGHSDESGPWAIEHHLPALEQLWFLTTDRTEPVAQKLKRKYDDLRTHQEEVTHHFRPKDTANAVSRAVSHAASLGLSPADLICDVTGGTSAMTAGAILACLELGIDAQMVAASYQQGALDVEKSIDVIDLKLHRSDEDDAVPASP